MQDVDSVGIALAPFAVVGLKLIAKGLQCCVTKGADTNGTVTLLLAGSLESIDAGLASPIVDDFDVSLEAHVYIVVLGPVHPSSPLGFFTLSTLSFQSLPLFL